MERHTWARLEEVFFQALELPLADRPAFLDRICGDDAAFRREIDAVLSGHYRAGGTQDALGLLPSVTDAAAGASSPGTRIGVYELEVLIGRGGMGEVYRAHRADDLYQQQVAIKLMRPGRDSVELMRRFRTERQILARLQHPGIATLLDGGVTELGRPYLVMQYVDGTAITTYARERDLGLDARLRLFLAVCDAVHHAHANLVIHRDLKPSNILVTTDGDVRLLDFGIAKLLDHDSLVETPTGDLLLLTPEHAAPEQFLGSPSTTATDGYALGVLLYELLTGSRPFQLVPAPELHRAVCEVEPDQPSRAAKERARLAAVGLDRPPVAPERIAGDLDSIVLKALRKDPERRFHSVADLADDVRRHLAGFPVRARPESLRYVASRFVRRHRVGVTASGALLLALLALAAVSVQFGVTSRAQARTIAEERDVALEVSGFLETLFASADPFGADAGRMDTLRVRDILDDGVRKARAELADRPAVQARLMTVMGKAQANLGRLDVATTILEEALRIRAAELGTPPLDLAATQRALGEVLWQTGQDEAAENLFRTAVTTLPPDSANRSERSKILNALGNALQRQGRFADAEAAYREALELGEAVSGPDDAELASLVSNVATAVAAQSRRDEADSLFQRAIALARSGVAVDHPRVAALLGARANLKAAQGQLDASIRLHEEGLGILRANLPTPHPRTASALNNLAAAHQRRGDLVAAESLFTEALAMQAALPGDRRRPVAETMFNLAQVMGDRGRVDEALARKREAVGLLTEVIGPDHPTLATMENSIGRSLHQLGRHEEATVAFRDALRIRLAALGDAHPWTAQVRLGLGACLIDLHRYADAEVPLLDAYRSLEPRRAEEARYWDGVLEQLGRLYRAMGRPAEAKHYEDLRVAAAPAGR